MNEAPPGRIITFYSFKGGTGRSMALANIAWILASNGRRVLALDWDLEAPGLHRYFHPFLEDKELEYSAGLIDFFVNFSAAARVAKSAAIDGTRRAGETADPWYEAQASLVPYTYSLAWDFPGDGTVDFVPAGRQDAGYSVLVTSFDWEEFYEELGGGVFLERVKQRLREDYDYVLIDSRTGISDTSGICTVQMPDDLVACFTLNQQSMKGSAAVANSAWKQRRRESGEPSLRVWPVPTRIELGEKERLDGARRFYQNTFQKFIGHLKRSERALYWKDVETLYQPFFAYEEVLAVFAERRHQTASLLSSLEALTRHLTDPRIEGLGSMSEHDRQRGLSLFNQVAAPRPTGRSDRRVYLSYSREDRNIAERIYVALRERDVDVFWDADILPGQDWREQLRLELERSDAVVCLLGQTGATTGQDEEIARALRHGIAVVPVLVPGTGLHVLPGSLANLNAAQLGSDEAQQQESILRLADNVGRLLQLRARPQQLDPDDPQKGRFGGAPTRNGRELSVKVMKSTPKWFDVLLQVRSLNERPLEGTVEFHLHPTFGREVETIPVIDGLASLRLSAWGAFTVGAIADDGRTALELDLSQDMGLPASFRER